MRELTGEEEVGHDGDNEPKADIGAQREPALHTRLHADAHASHLNASEHMSADSQVARREDEDTHDNIEGYDNEVDEPNEVNRRRATWPQQ